MGELDPSIHDEDWVQKPLTVIVIPGLSEVALGKVYPALRQLSNFKPDLEVWAVDSKDITTTEFQQDYLIQPILEASDEDFLSCCAYKRISPLDDCRSLTQLLQLTSGPSQNLVVWFADDSDNNVALTETIHLSYKRITPSIFQGWTRVIVEPPFFKETMPWKEIEQVYRLHPLLASSACQQISAFRQRQWAKSLFHARAVQAVYVKVETTMSVYSVLPQVYHVLASLAMKMPDNGSEPAVSIPTARSEVLDRVSPYCRPQDILLGNRTDGDHDGPKRTGTRDPTYLCVRCWVGSDVWAGVPFFLEIRQTDKALVDGTLDIRVDLRDETCHDSLTFNERSAQLSMASITDGLSQGPSPRIETDITGGSASTLDGRARLALDAFRGQKALFVGAVELEALHAVVDPLVKQCRSTNPEPYTASEEGPQSRETFLNDICSPTAIE
jgi:glucose-6-phosphate 1-dehydrogenase